MSHFFDETNPFTLFSQWFNEACACSDIKEPTAVSLATVADNIPSNRMVLLKEHDERGFVFYTNLESRKSTEIHHNPYAALCFYWSALDKQIRIVGQVKAVDNAQADAYFASRSRGKQLGAWASKQSRIMHQQDDLQTRIDALEQQFGQQPIPRPPHWSGWRIIPQEMEFWHQKEFRLHERMKFVLHDQQWKKNILYP